MLVVAQQHLSSSFNELHCANPNMDLGHDTNCNMSKEQQH